MNIPEELKYTEEHEWAKQEGDQVTIGITDWAQDRLTDIVFVDLPEVGTAVTAGEAFGAVESVKSASDLFAPISGEVVEVNSLLADKPEVINGDPYGEGWMVKIKSADASAFGALMSAADYTKFVETQS